MKSSTDLIDEVGTLQSILLGIRCIELKQLSRLPICHFAYLDPFIRVSLTERPCIILSDPFAPVL